MLFSMIKTDKNREKSMNTTRKRSNEELRQANAYNRRLIEASLDPMVVISPKGKITDVNAATEVITGVSRDALIGSEFANYFVEPEKAEAIYQEVFRTGLVRDYASEICHLDGHVTPVLYNATAYRDDARKELGVCATARDISHLKQTEEELRQANTYNRRLIETSLDPIVVISPKGKITDVNAATEAITGWSRDVLIGTDFSNYFGNPMAARVAYHLVFQTGSVHNYALEIRHRDSHVTPVLYNATIYRDDTGKVLGVFTAARDISERKRTDENIDELQSAKEQLQELAYHDPLTHLPNRRLLDDRLHQAIAQNLRTDLMIAICYFDLDGFKPVNDQLGHDVGDQLLIEVASRLLSIVRGGDTVARIGGDEFVLLLSELTNLEECKQILARLLDGITAPYSSCDAQQFKISASIGVTLFPQDTADQDTLLRHADQAMYAAKQNGRNCYRLFDLFLERQLAGKREMLECIQQGLSTGEFCLYFQPQVNFGREALVGAEALIRWQHPTMGLLSPAEFLPAVENDDMALVMGNWVIREALRQMQIWRREGINLQVSINTFARQLRKPDFMASLQQILSEYPDVPPSQLQIEITETAILPELPVIQQIITDCQQLGVGFSIDDFGTGYSSLVYLRHLSAKELKIDQSFVCNMLTNHEDQDIIEGIIALGRSFKRSVIAEGVETAEQIHRLLELGCEAMQGYGIARPMPSEQIVTWVRDFQPAQLLS
jgi:diguanylate cyclase (GGDEF)-like protein/PAS domain S-box-containing protein